MGFRGFSGLFGLLEPDEFPIISSEYYVRVFWKAYAVIGVLKLTETRSRNILCFSLDARFSCFWSTLHWVLEQLWKVWRQNFFLDCQNWPQNICSQVRPDLLDNKSIITCNYLWHHCFFKAIMSNYKSQQAHSWSWYRLDVHSYRLTVSENIKIPKFSIPVNMLICTSRSKLNIYHLVNIFRSKDMMFILHRKTI